MEPKDYLEILVSLDEFLPPIDRLRVAKYRAPVSFLAHSLSVAFVADWAAAVTGLAPRRLAFAAGLLHDYYQKIAKNYGDPENRVRAAEAAVAGAAGLGAAERDALETCVIVNCAENPGALVPGYGAGLSRVLRVADVAVSKAYAAPEAVAGELRGALGVDLDFLVLRASIPQVLLRTEVLSRALSAVAAEVEEPDKLLVLLTVNGVLAAYPGRLPRSVVVDVWGIVDELVASREWVCGGDGCSVVANQSIRSKAMRRRALELKEAFLDKRVGLKLYSGAKYLFEGVELGGVEYVDAAGDRRCFVCGAPLAPGEGGSFDARLYSNIIYGKGLERWSPRFKAHGYIAWSKARRDELDRYVRACPLCMLEALVAAPLGGLGGPVLALTTVAPTPLQVLYVLGGLASRAAAPKGSLRLPGFADLSAADVDWRGYGIGSTTQLIDYATASIIRVVGARRGEEALMYNGDRVAVHVLASTLYPARYLVGGALPVFPAADALVAAERYYPAVSYSPAAYARRGRDELPALSLALLHAASAHGEYEYLFLRPEHAELALHALGEQKLLSEIGAGV